MLLNYQLLIFTTCKNFLLHRITHTCMYKQFCSFIYPVTLAILTVQVCCPYSCEVIWFSPNCGNSNSQAIRTGSTDFSRRGKCLGCPEGNYWHLLPTAIRSQQKASHTQGSKSGATISNHVLYYVSCIQKIVRERGKAFFAFSVSKHFLLCFILY